MNEERFFVYVLHSLKDRGLHIGYTTNLKRRFLEHINGQVISTKYRRPLELIHYEYFVDTRDAKARERFLKSGYGRDQMAQLLKRTFLSRRTTSRI